MEDTFSNLETYGYIALFIYSLGGGFLGIVAAGVLSYMGKMDLVTSILVVFLANALGDVMLFLLTRYQKNMMMESLRKHRRKLALSHILMKKYGDVVIFIQKFIYGVKTIVPIAIALTKYDFKKFFILNLFASFIFAVTFGVASYFFGAPLKAFALFIADNKWLAPVILITIGTILWWYLSHFSKKR